VKPAAFLSRAIEPLLIVPAAEWGEILDRPNIRGLAQACLVLGMVISWSTMPVIRWHDGNWAETVPDMLSIAVMAMLLWVITFHNSHTVYMLPLTVLSINVLFCTFNVIEMVVAGSPFDVRMIYYSLIY